MNKELQNILAQAYADSGKAGKLFFPSRFHREWTRFHKKVFEIVDKRPEHPDYKNKKLIVLPRGMGKTSISNLLIPAKKALFQESRYIVPVSASSTLAIQQSENLKWALSNNKSKSGKIISKLFGDIRTKVHNKEQWILNIGGEEDGKEICIMPRGAGQQIRGLLFRDFRPDLYVVDDLEDPENMDSEEQRKKKSDWFWGDLMQSVDNYAPKGSWEVIVVGTVLHQDSLVVNLMENDDWDKVVFPICDEDFHSLIPEWWSDQDVLNKYNELKKAGKTTTFYREYMNRPNAGGKDAKFQRSMFKYYDPHVTDFFGKRNTETVILVDIARTVSEESTESAIVGVTIDFENIIEPAIYITDIVRGKFHPDELYDEIFAMETRIGAQALGVEVTGLHEFITYPIKNEMVQRGSRMELIELQARGGVNEKGKAARVGTLIPYYRRGQIYHHPDCCSGLELQLESYPAAKRWDIMDALAYIIQLLESGERYMREHYGDVEEEYEDYDEIEAEYRDLGYMEEALDGFRVYQ